MTDDERPLRLVDPGQASTVRGAARPPESVAIVAMGASSATYAQLICSLGDRHEIADETWVINATAGVFAHDRAFVLQDIKHNITRESRDRKIAQGILKWLPNHPGPVYSTTAYPEWPALVEYPTQDVLRKVGGAAYLNNSVAYAVAFAIYIGVKRLWLFGCDFTYPDNHASESGRGCVEFWLGVAAAKGVEIVFPDTTTLLDSNVAQDKRLYGYAAPMLVSSVDGQLYVHHKDHPPCSSTPTSSVSPPAPPLPLAQAQ